MRVTAWLSGAILTMASKVLAAPPTVPPHVLPHSAHPYSHWPVPGELSFWEEENWEGDQIRKSKFNKCHLARGKGHGLLEVIRSLEQGPHSACTYYSDSNCNRPIFERRSYNYTMTQGVIPEQGSGCGFYSVMCVPNNVTEEPDVPPVDSMPEPPTVVAPAAVKRQDADPANGGIVHFYEQALENGCGGTNHAITSKNNCVNIPVTPFNCFIQYYKAICDYYKEGVQGVG